jgi:hypothetical protein
VIAPANSSSPRRRTKLTSSFRIGGRRYGVGAPVSIRRESDAFPWKSLSGATRFTGEGDDKPGCPPYGQPYVGSEPSGRNEDR